MELCRKVATELGINIKQLEARTIGQIKQPFSDESNNPYFFLYNYP